LYDTKIKNDVGLGGADVGDVARNIEETRKADASVIATMNAVNNGGGVPVIKNLLTGIYDKYNSEMAKVFNKLIDVHITNMNGRAGGAGIVRQAAFNAAHNAVTGGIIAGASDDVIKNVVAAAAVVAATVTADVDTLKEASVGGGGGNDVNIKNAILVNFRDGGGGANTADGAGGIGNAVRDAARAAGIGGFQANIMRDKMIAASIDKAAVIDAAVAGVAFITATDAAIQELAEHAAKLVVDSILTENPILKAEKEQETVGKEKIIREKNALVDKFEKLQAREIITLALIGNNIINDVDNYINLLGRQPLNAGADRTNIGTFPFSTKEGHQIIRRNDLHAGADDPNWILIETPAIVAITPIPGGGGSSINDIKEIAPANGVAWFNTIEGEVERNIRDITNKKRKLKELIGKVENFYIGSPTDRLTEEAVSSAKVNNVANAIKTNGVDPIGNAWIILVADVPPLPAAPVAGIANAAAAIELAKRQATNREIARKLTQNNKIESLNERHAAIINDPDLILIYGQAILRTAFPDNINTVNMMNPNMQETVDEKIKNAEANNLIIAKSENKNRNTLYVGDLNTRTKILDDIVAPYEKTLNDLKDTIDEIKKKDDEIAGVNKTISDIIEIGGDSSSNVFMTPLAFAKEVSSRIANFNRDRGDTKPPLSGKLYTALKFMIAVDDSFYTILDGDNFDNMAPNHKEKYCKAIDDLIASGNLAITADTALDKIKDKSEDDKKIANADDNDITLSQWLLALNSIYAKIKKKFERELEQGSENLKGTELTIEATRRIKTEVEKYNNKNTPELIEAANKVFSTARRAGVGGGKANLGTLVAIDLIIKVIRDNILEQKDKNYKLEDIDSIVEKIGSVEKIKEVKENNKNAAGKKGKKNHLTDTTQIAKIKNWMESDAVYDTDYKQFKIRFPKIKLSKEAYEDQFK
jgi:hypothetical protein